MKEKWEKREGVYGICITEKGLLVIDKTQGPYRKRYDLPGGGLEPGETQHSALHREVKEETGLKIQIKDNLGKCEFLVPWPTQTSTHLHHIVHLYQIETLTTKILSPKAIEGQDSVGAHWLALDQLTVKNASPLALQAKNWTRTRTLSQTLQRLNTWIIKET